MSQDVNAGIVIASFSVCMLRVYIHKQQAFLCILLRFALRNVVLYVHIHTDKYIWYKYIVIAALVIICNTIHFRSTAGQLKLLHLLRQIMTIDNERHGNANEWLQKFERINI